MIYTYIGTVYLVGAGPGDPGLVTVRGLELLKRADVVIYDYLANPALLEAVPATCEILYVGKRGRGERVPQDAINALLVEKARAGKCVVRLKGGDPFIFGRGGEEAAYLVAHGVPFEVVPGVSAGIAVPAYAGIPLTHRDCAAEVVFVAGHEAGDDGPSKVDWGRLAKTKGTIVVFMGVTKLEEIARDLMAAGMAAATPAAVIRWGTYPGQKTVTATLETIAAVARRDGIKPPALLVIGEVVSARDTLAWFEKTPLFGKKIAVTRSHRQNAGAIQALCELGAEVIAFPTVEIHPPESFDPLDRSIAERAQYQWLVFTSANSVRAFFARLAHLRLDARALGHLRVAGVGEATEAALRQHGIVADCVPSEYTQEGLLQALQERGVARARAWLPAAAEIRSTLPDGLRRLGCEVDVIPVYRTLCPEKPACELEAVDWVTFTSASTVKNFVHLLGGDKVKTLLAAGMRVACIGPITRAAAAGLGLPCHLMPEPATVENLVKAIVEHERKA